MPNKNPRSADQQHSDRQSKETSGQMERQPIAPLEERREAQEIGYQTYYQNQPPKSPVFRWLWKYSQTILSALTFLVLVVYGAQWWQARETREIENRAYVVVKTVGLRQQADNPNMSDIVITITNTGRTPGLNGVTRAQLLPSERPIPEDAGFPPLDSTPSRTVLAPQIDSEMTLGPVLNKRGEEAIQRAAQESAAQAAQSEKTKGSSPAPITMPTPAPTASSGPTKFTYVYGYVTYDDVFGRAHQTRFCYFNIPGTLSWNGCPAFNSFN
jgi:hypothetical protein